MSNTYSIKQETLSEIADAVREKKGSTERYTPNDMANVIRNMETGNKWNIAYGDTAPAEESTLWVKCAVPVAAEVRTSLQTGNERMQIGVASLPVEMCSIASVRVGGKVFLFGGRTNDYARPEIQCFDPETREITTLATKLITSAWGIGAAAVGTKVYLFGGTGSQNHNTNRIEVFDTETNTITTLNVALPVACGGIAAVAMEKNIYLFGGSDDDSSGLNSIQVFNTETNVLTQFSITLPSEAGYISAAAMGTKIYLLGGKKDGNNWLDSILVFDTKTQTMETLTEKLPVTMASAATAAVGTNIYLFGGYNGTDRSEIIKFNAETLSAEVLTISLPSASSYAAGASVGNKIYIFGGWGSSMLSTIHEFVAGMDLAANHVLLDSSTMNHKFHILPSLEIGIANVYRGNADGVAEKVTAALYINNVWVEI